MNGIELIQRLKAEDMTGRPFIKWWRREEDFVDYDLVERFMAHRDELLQGQEVEGYELATVEDVWAEAKRLCGDRLSREPGTMPEVFTWRRGDRIQTCALTPENVLRVLDTETRGNLVD